MKGDLEKIYEIFKGRTDVHSQDQVCIKEPITDELLLKHLNGEKRIGICPLMDDNKIHLIAVESHDTNSMQMMKIYGQCKDFILHPYIEVIKEDGIKRGYRLWLFFSESVKAVEARLVIEFIMQSQNIERYNIIPDRDEIKEGDFGALVFLPLFGCKIKTDKKQDKIFPDVDNKEILDSLGKLKKIEKTEAYFLGDIIRTNELERDPYLDNIVQKPSISDAIITLTYRNPEIMIFKKKDLEFRVSNISVSKTGELKASLTLSNEKGFLIKDFINFGKETQRGKFVKKLNDDELDFDIVKIEELVNEQLKKEEKEKLKRPRQLYVMTENEKDEALGFLETTPKLLHSMVKLTDKMGLVGEEALRLMVYLCYTSRITKTPLSIAVKGESSSGKSFLCTCVQKLIPEEGRYFISKATQQAFFHLPEDGLQHRIVFIAEQPGSEQADYSIRTAQSEGDLVLMIPLKDPVTGDIETKTKTVKGPVGFLMTTTKPTLFDENETRNFSIYTDDSAKLTSRIKEILIRKGLGDSFEIEPQLLNLMKNIQRLLNPNFKIIIPFSREIFSAFPDRPVRIRRDSEKFRVMIEVITLLHQFHRKQYKDKKGKIILEATVADYYLAKMIAGDILLHTIYEIGPASKEIWDIILSLNSQFFPEDSTSGGFSFKYKDLIKLCEWKYPKVKKWVLTLLKAGYIEYREGSIGGRGKVAEFKIADKFANIKALEAIFLPSVEALVKKYPCGSELFYHPFTGEDIDPFLAEAPEEIEAQNVA